MNEVLVAGKTAIGRNRCAAPTYFLIGEDKHPYNRVGSRDFHGKVLHFGCGRDFYTGWEIANDNRYNVTEIVEYDPNLDKFEDNTNLPKLHGTERVKTNKLPKTKFDFVICNYVMNVLPEFERRKAMRDLVSCLKKDGTAYIAVRGFGDTISGDPYQDGYRTTRNTFQRIYAVKDFRKFLSHYFGEVKILHGGLSEAILLAECKGVK